MDILIEISTRICSAGAEKATTCLARRFDTVVLEDLRVRNMMRSAAGTIEALGTRVAQKRGLNRSISEQ